MTTATTRQRPRRRRGEPRSFDFRRPSTISREHACTLQIVQETMARGFTTSLASALRVVSQVAIRDIEQQPYDEYLREIPNPTALTLLSLRPLASSAILHIPLQLGFVATELMLGGVGGQEQPDRQMTDLELALLATVVDLLVPDLRYAFEPVAAIQPSTIGQESNPQFAQLAASTDMVIVLSFDVRIADATDVMTLCIPFGALQPHLDALSASGDDHGLTDHAIATGEARLREHLSAAGVEARATFRTATATSSQIVDLRVGDLLMLNHPVEMPLTLEAGGVPLHDVAIGRINRHLGLRIVGAVPPDRYRTPSRAQVLSGDSPPAEAPQRHRRSDPSSPMLSVPTSPSRPHPTVGSSDRTRRRHDLGPIASETTRQDVDTYLTDRAGAAQLQADGLSARTTCRIGPIQRIGDIPRPPPGVLP